MSRLETLKLLKERGVLTASEKEELQTLLNQEKDEPVTLYVRAERVRAKALKCANEKDYKGMRDVYRGIIKDYVKDNFTELLDRLEDCEYLRPVTSLESFDYSDIVNELLNQDLLEDESYNSFIFSCTNDDMNWDKEQAIVAGMYQECIRDIQEKTFKAVIGYELPLVMLHLPMVGVTLLPIVITNMKSVMPEQFKNLPTTRIDIRLGMGIIHEALNDTIELLTETYNALFGSNEITEAHKVFTKAFFDELEGISKGRLETLEKISKNLETLLK